MRLRAALVVFIFALVLVSVVFALLSVAQESFCPDKYQMDELRDECVKMTRIPPQVTCPEGSRAERNAESDDEEIACVERRWAAAELSCEQGYNLERGRCVMKFESPPSLGCPDGWDDGDGDCVIVYTAKPKNHCSAGLHLDASGLVCVKSVARVPIKTCPEPYDMHRGMCLLKAKATPGAEPPCPNGFNKSALSGDFCVAVDSLPPELGCAAGGVLDEDGDCVAMETIEPLYVCNATLLTDGECFDVELSRRELRCPRGSTLVESTTTCLFTSEDSASPPSPCSTTDEGSTCVDDTVDVEPQLACPDGFVDQESGDFECVRRISLSLERQCPPGYGESRVEGQVSCVSRNMYPATVGCDIHTQRDRQLNGEHLPAVELNGDGCQRMIIKCPTGLVRDPEDPDSCIQILREMPMFECPPGSEFDLGGVDEDNGIPECMEVSYEEPEFRCPRDFHTCGASEDRCCRQRRRPYRQECSDGDRLAEGVCVKVERIEPEVACPLGYEYQRGQCIQLIFRQGTLSCPQGYERTSGEECVREHVVPTYVVTMDVENVIDNG